MRWKGIGRDLISHGVPTLGLAGGRGAELELPRGALVVLIAHQEHVLPGLHAVQHVQPAAGLAGQHLQAG